MKGIPVPAEPIPAESFGWVWSKWLTLLRAQATAEHRAQVATTDPERRAAANAVEMCRYDLEKFRRETAEGLALALRFAAEFAPVALRDAVAVPLSDAAGRAADESYDRLQTRLRRLEQDNERLRGQVAEFAELVPALRLIASELGYAAGGGR